MKNSLHHSPLRLYFVLIQELMMAHSHNGALTHLNEVNYFGILIHQGMSQLLSEPLMTLKQECVARQIALSRQALEFRAYYE